jgi:hypothetical protein
MITREDLTQSKMVFTAHVDGTDYIQNHFRNNRWPRFGAIVTSPRGRKSKVVFSKRFFVDGVEVFRCSDLLERLNAPQLAVVGKGEAA